MLSRVLGSLAVLCLLLGSSVTGQEVCQVKMEEPCPSISAPNCTALSFSCDENMKCIAPEVMENSGGHAYTTTRLADPSEPGYTTLTLDGTVHCYSERDCHDDCERFVFGQGLYINRCKPASPAGDWVDAGEAYDHWAVSNPCEGDGGYGGY